jgi:NAD(P)H dehydrogenase (quinone)
MIESKYYGGLEVIKMSSKKVLILYFSGSGNTQRMAKAIGEAMRSEGLNVMIEDVKQFDTSLLPNYDALVLGSPTYFSNIAWQVKKMVDESIMHYSGKKLRNKVAGIFTSAGTKRDGQDCLKMLEIALRVHHGMNVVGSLIRVDGESTQEVEKSCQEYGKQLAKEIGKEK